MIDIIKRINKYINESFREVESLGSIKKDIKYRVGKDNYDVFVKFTGRLDSDNNVEVTDGKKTWFINPDKLIDSRIGLIDRMAERRKNYKVTHYVEPEKTKFQKIKDVIKKEFGRI
jgi:hypothetical protein